MPREQTRRFAIKASMASGRLPLMCALLGLAACAGAPPVEEPPPTPVHELVPADPGQFGERPDIPTPEEIHRLDPEQRAAFLRFIKDPIRSTTPRHRRVVEYLQRIAAEVHVRGDAFMAAAAVAQGSGNGLALVSVTAALVRLGNVGVGDLLADDGAVFEFNG